MWFKLKGRECIGMDPSRPNRQMTFEAGSLVELDEERNPQEFKRVMQMVSTGWATVVKDPKQIQAAKDKIAESVRIAAEEQKRVFEEKRKADEKARAAATAMHMAVEQTEPVKRRPGRPRKNPVAP